MAITSFFVYLLVSDRTGKTYVGATVDLDHRLRQHNRLLKGGAKYTTRAVERGESWSRVCHVAGFPTWQAALQFEWRFKQLTRKLRLSKEPILETRFRALQHLLSLDRATSRATYFRDWPVFPHVVCESDRAAQLFGPSSSSTTDDPEEEREPEEQRAQEQEQEKAMEEEDDDAP